MGKLKLTSIAASELNHSSLKGGYLYKDVLLDLHNRTSFNKKLNRNEELKDIEGLYDIDSIKNSIVNAFLTSPGQKILNPQFGIDLRRYLFDPVDNFQTDLIEEDILEDLPEQEPRIELLNVVVEADEDQNQYNITLQINVPSLNVYGLSIKSELNSNGYYII